VLLIYLFLEILNLNPEECLIVWHGRGYGDTRVARCCVCMMVFVRVTNCLVEMTITRKKGSMWKNCGPYEIRCFDGDLWSGKYLSF
jgi:hypothetical protein